MRFYEFSKPKPITPEQARIKALQTQKDNVNNALKAERDRQKVAKARKVITTVSQPTLPKL